MPARQLIAAAILCLLAGCQALRWDPGAGGEVIAGPLDSVSTAIPPLHTPDALSSPAGGEVPANPLRDEDSLGASDRLHASNPLRDDYQSRIETVSFHEPQDFPPLAEPLFANASAGQLDPSISLEELEQLALANNPVVAQAAARVRALRGRWVQSGLPPNPTVGYRGEEIGGGGTAGMQGGFVGQDLITGGKLGLNRAVVSQEIRGAEQQLAAAEWRVLTDVRLAYYDVLVAQRRLALAHELLGISQEAVDASERLLKQGEIPRIGLLQTEVEARNTLILQRRAEIELDAAWTRLTSVVGLPQMQQAHVAGNLEDVTVILDFEQQLARLVNESPETAEALAEVARACWALERAYAEVVPDVSTQAAVMYNNASGDTVAGVQISMPLPLWNRNQGGIQEASHEVAAARRNAERVELSLRERLATAFQQYADARYQVGIYSGEILPKARESLNLVATGYDAGEVGYLDLLAAQRTYFQTTLSYIEALRDLWRATIRIDGMLLSESLERGGA